MKINDIKNLLTEAEKTVMFHNDSDRLMFVSDAIRTYTSLAGFASAGCEIYVRQPNGNMRRAILPYAQRESESATS